MSSSRQVLLPRAARRPAALVAVGCLVVVAALGIASAHQAHGDALDRAVDSWVTGLHVPGRVLSLVSQLGGVPAVTVLTGAVALACLAARRVSGAVLAVAGVALASAVTEFAAKPLVHRTISGYLSYPSGHTTGLFALAAAIAVVMLGTGRAGRRLSLLRFGAAGLAVLVACAVGLAMVALRYHYFTDTIGGAATGSGVVLALTFPLEVWLSRPGTDKAPQLHATAAADPDR